MALCMTSRTACRTTGRALYTNAAPRLAPPSALPKIKEVVVPKLLAAGLAVGMLLNPTPAPAQAYQLKTLADISRPAFGGNVIDLNQDGVVTKDELANLTNQGTGMGSPKDALLAFTVRLFDLNQDGVLTTEEVLTGMTLNTVVYEDNRLDADVYKVFDQNGDGVISLEEWKAPFGNLGEHGDDLKAWTYKHVEFLGDGDHQLNAAELSNALELMRLELLGY